jgi:hypothetical protein
MEFWKMAGGEELQKSREAIDNRPGFMVVL